MRSKQSVVRIQDVARAAGVSVTTASRVLNNKDDVAPETYARVRRVMAELNYTASLAAKSMRSRTTNVIGLVLPDVTDAFNLAVIRGVGTTIRMSSYDLLIYTIGNPGRNTRASWEQEHVAMLSSGLTDGCIVVTSVAPTFPETARIVVVDPNGNGASVPSVIATNRFGAMELMRYLIGLGHRRIGFITGRSDTQSATRRFLAYQEGLAEAGIPFDPDLVEEGDYTRDRGQAAARLLLDRPDRPTAIFAANDQTALGVMDIAAQFGLRIPQDLSVAGFDNIPESMHSTPRLTTIDQSIHEMGALAAKMLIAILQGEDLGEPLHKIPTRLIVRESCQPPAPQ
jgi:LacI family transcriptional regulator